MTVRIFRPKFSLLITIGFVLLVSFNNQDASTHLPQFSIDVNTDDLNFGDYIDGEVTYTNAAGFVQHNASAIGIKYRGNASAHYDKKSYSLKFDCETCLGDVMCHKKWKLNAEYIDKTFIRNKLSYDLFRSFSTQNLAPRIMFVTMNMNGSYQGIYALTERVDSDLLRLNKKDTGAVLFKQPPISFPPEEHSKRHEEFVGFCGWADFYQGFSAKAKDKLIKETYYNQRYPDIDKRDKKYLIHELTQYIFNSDDAEFLDYETFSKHFDLDNIIDWHILLLTTNNGDGLVKNFYLFKQETGQPFRFCPWDYDHTFGRDGDGELNHQSFVDARRAALLKRLLDSNAFDYKRKLLNKFMQLKNRDILTVKNIHRMIDTNAAILSPFVDENEQKWPPNAIAHFYDTDFKNEVLLMKKWIETRLPEVEGYLLELQQNK